MISLTEEQKSQNVAALRAAYDGKPWQYDYAGVWVSPSITTIEEALLSYLCRPAPEPEPPRPWDCPDDVPGPVCWIGRPSPNGGVGMVLSVDSKGLASINTLGEVDNYSWREIERQKAIYSTDRKTWKPCHKLP